MNQKTPHNFALIIKEKIASGNPLVRSLTEHGFQFHDVLRYRITRNRKTVSETHFLVSHPTKTEEESIEFVNKTICPKVNGQFSSLENATTLTACAVERKNHPPYGYYPKQIKPGHVIIIATLHKIPKPL